MRVDEPAATGRSAGVLQIGPCYSDTVSVDRNRARQLLTPERAWNLERSGHELTLSSPPLLPIRVIRQKSGLGDGVRVLLVPRSIDLEAVTDLRDLASVRWLGNLAASSSQDVLKSLEDAFSFRAEDLVRGIRGLRGPQIGALFAVLGHWTTGSTQPVTVVMPTGTGKTETMLALFARARLERLLVLVPSDVLRDQIANSFETLGILQECQVVAPMALRPVVGRIKHRFTSRDAAATFAQACNAVVTTPGALAASALEVQESLIGQFSHLFIDEAHHVAAETWRRVRDAFADRQVVQFTATPYREDGRHLGGRLLYAFPLREAQRQGYFSKINYVSVVNFEDAEGAIARRAIEQLRTDLAAGRDHLLLARVNRIGRADEVLSRYQQIAPDLNPVIVHSKAKRADREAAVAAMRSRSSRIIVCVDMLGEGFDLPSLKIAAIHDPHKTLGVTLQFVGRFARASTTTIGEATVVVGRPDLAYDDTLRRLYSEDADWNFLIRDISEVAVGAQQEVSDFEAGFGSQPDEVAIQSLLPRMSTVVYRTTSDSWDPEGALKVYPEERLLTFPIAVNARDGVAWFVTEQRAEVRWGDIKSVEEIAHELFVLYFDAQRRLLYINSSYTASLHEDLAMAVCGESVQRIKGEEVFRAMAGVTRLVPTNVGVLDFRNRARRFSMHVGADVSEGFPVAEAQTKTKTNIFAYGYENGQRVSIGASLKGRVWSYRIASSIKEWVDWCDHVGGKLIDESLAVDEIMAHFIRPQAVENRPELVALGLEWPWEIFFSTTEEVRVASGADEWPIVDAELTVASMSTTGPIQFAVTTDGGSFAYSLDFIDGAMAFKAIGQELEVVTRGIRRPLSEYLSQHGVTVFLERDATIVPPALLLQVDRELPAYDPASLEAIDWTGIDLHKESQGSNRDADSIQARAIAHLQSLGDWDLIIDDDGSGEIADIVAMRIDEKELFVQLVHCKFSSGAPGSRVGDFYELCGQAQKSVRWRRSTSLMFRQLIRREKKRIAAHGRSGLIVGDGNKLFELEDRSRFVRSRFAIAMAQPGLSRVAATPQVLELLASTEVYVKETALADLTVFCSS